MSPSGGMKGKAVFCHVGGEVNRDAIAATVTLKGVKTNHR